MAATPLPPSIRPQTGDRPSLKSARVSKESNSDSTPRGDGGDGDGGTAARAVCRRIIRTATAAE